MINLNNSTVRLLSACCMFFFASALAQAETIHVGKSRPIQTVQKGIDLAKKGGNVLVYTGKYKEGNIILQKKYIVLKGNFYPVLEGQKKY
jgi:hypothetical protein